MAEDIRQWTRTEGIIVAEDLDPKAVGDFINTTRVVVAMDWYERTPNLIGLTLATEDRKLAAVNDMDQIVPMVEYEDFALEVAQKFNAEVIVGEVSADSLPEGAEVSSEPASEPAGTKKRIVELGSIPESSIPLAAAITGVDIVSKSMNNGWHALAYTSEFSRNVASLGEYPVVTLTVSENEFNASLAMDDDPESQVMYNWSMSTRTLAAGHVGDEVAELAEELVGASTDLRDIALAVPEADISAAEATAQLEGTNAVLSFVRALGAPSAVSDFLLGKLDAEDIPGGELHEARGISNALGRSVDKILLDPESSGNAFWETYHTAAVKHPWIVRTIASVEAALGATLLVNAIRSEKPRSGWVKFGGFVGGMMMVDSVAEVMLAKYLGIRAERRRNE